MLIEEKCRGFNIFMLYFELKLSASNIVWVILLSHTRHCYLFWHVKIGMPVKCLDPM